MRTGRKPAWLNKQLNLEQCRALKRLLRSNHLRTVCEESSCPNISECFAGGIATFIILGDICTRACQFCGIAKGKPRAGDPGEPQRIRNAVMALKLRYVVVTSPTRDDLPDKGLSAFLSTVEAIQSLGRAVKVEILIPDFSGESDLLRPLADCKAAVIAHNVETVPSLYIKVRKGADYQRSLSVLRILKEKNKNIVLKSGLMLGLGESLREVERVIVDLRSAECDLLTLGQYLPPSAKHYPVKQYITVDTFNELRDYALALGFKGVKSGPYVRSSYQAHSFHKS